MYLMSCMDFATPISKTHETPQLPSAGPGWRDRVRRYNKRGLPMHRPALLLALAVATLGLPLPAEAQSIDFPTRRPGYWEIRIVTEKPTGAPSMDTQVCLDAATDRELMEFGLRMSKDACTRFDM